LNVNRFLSAFSKFLLLVIVMSHASLENILAEDWDAWQQDYRLSLAGTSN